MRKSRRIKKSRLPGILTAAGLLLWLALSGCASAPAAKTSPIIPPLPVLPIFSDEFNRTAPVEDLEKLGNYAGEVEGVYRILVNQLKAKEQ